jgi:nucleoside-diphosphate-sugar epimerase
MFYRHGAPALKGNTMDFSHYEGLPVLVTGGAGFIGSHLVRGLVNVGANVLVMDNFCASAPENLRELEGQIGILEGDITHMADCERAMEGRKVVFHLAALGSVPRSVEEPVQYNTNNIGGALNVFDAARRAGVKRIVYSASSSCYGDTPVLPKVETMTPTPKSPYAITKLVGEYYAKVYAEVYGMSTISLRYFNVFGPRQNPKSQYAAVIPAFASAIIRGNAPKIYGDGGQTRDFCFVDNVVYANMLGGSSERPLKGESVNIACGQNISLNAMLEKMQTLLGKKVTPEYLPTRAGDVRDSLADIAAAERVLGYKPQVLFDEGLKRTCDWYARNLK